MALPTPDTVTVYGAHVILSEAKNLAWNRHTDEILRFAQNDGISRAVNGYPNI
jgi:hypothetical protein